MSNAEASYPSLVETFGIEIKQSTADLPNIREGLSARDAIEHLEQAEDTEAIYAITHAVDEINKVVQITRNNRDRTEELIDLFTPEQLVDMGERIHEYLGSNIDEYTAEGGKPARYEFYVDRLGMYFGGNDTSVTTNFSEFEKRHTEPVTNAKGPYEHNSRRYANYANEMIVRNLTDFYQTGYNIRLLGSTKSADGMLVWARGIAECQFLVLDYVAVQVAKGFEQTIRLPNSEITMTLEDIGANITTLLTKRSLIHARARQINPIIAEQINTSISALAEFTQEVIYRGRWGSRQYEREPIKAKRQILNIASLLMQAVSLEYVQGQEEIPVLDLDSLLKE